MRIISYLLFDVKLILATEVTEHTEEKKGIGDSAFGGLAASVGIRISGYQGRRRGGGGISDFRFQILGDSPRSCASETGWRRFPSKWTKNIPRTFNYPAKAQRRKERNGW